MKFICKNAEADSASKCTWEGGVKHIKRNGNTIELEVFGRGSQMYVIVGKYSCGNYICIPEWGIGSPLASLDDRFWNRERLSRYIEKPDAITLSEALNVIKKEGLF